MKRNIDTLPLTLSRNCSREDVNHYPHTRKLKTDPKPFFIEHLAGAGAAEMGRESGHMHDRGLQALTDYSLVFDLICLHGKLQMQ